MGLALAIGVAGTSNNQYKKMDDIIEIHPSPLDKKLKEAKDEVYNSKNTPNERSADRRCWKLTLMKLRQECI